MNEVHWFHKAIIGASGGLCLSLLKLIDAGFYVDNISSKEAIVGYLTYFSFILIGVFVAIFLGEHEGTKEKIKRSAFVIGLLGPSVLVAIVKQPVFLDHGATKSIEVIPKIGQIFLSSAYAQPLESSGAALGGPSANVSDVHILKKQDIEPSINEAVWSALGRSMPVNDHVYVVGVTEDRAKALETANKINTLKSLKATGLKVQVVKPEGKNTYYITVGGPSTNKVALEAKASVQAAAVGTLTEDQNQASKKAAALLLEGKVVNGELLFQ